ncbi:E3 ubiquitin-protein ligase LRSAM1 [Leptinotarsa decemlineata]|uniref:E3 ubiquitin-protein ligase LRSAM1 n=1 Tax=Leptinotarsa decemlineata TaxID=7539 RepID=UPI003D3075AB
MFRKNKHANKAKLEHKLYLAREDPEPIFDLSECELQDVPSGVYSLCRVFLKESLRLEHNCLSSLSGGGNLKDLFLLKILDISDNNFKTIPENIYLLTGLQEFYAKNNNIKAICESFCKLTNLRVLDISNNSIKQLPEDIGSLVNLRKCDMSNNKLKKLPKSIYKWKKINSLALDSADFVFPPVDVVQNGLKSIMKFICEHEAVPFTYSPCEDISEDDIDQAIGIKKSSSFQQQKVQEFLEIERYNEILRKQEEEFANASKIKREKLLAVLSKQSNQFDQELNKLQQSKEIERFRLIEQLQEAENNADLAISQLLSLNNEPSGQILEQEKLEEERMLAAINRYNETLRKEDILEAMEDILAQETMKFKEFDQSRIESSRSILERETKDDSKLLEILQSQDERKMELVNQLKIDSDLQRAAVGTLLERGDARSWGILQQIRLVEAQLAALTKLEIDKKTLQMDQQLNDFCEKRYNLSVLLMELLEQQKERRSQLISTLQIMEQSNNQNMEDFWLKQYQRLLDKLPEGLSEAQKNISPSLAQGLLVNGVIHCLPFLAKLTQRQCDIRMISDTDLLEAGVNSEKERRSILDVFWTYEKEKETCGFSNVGVVTPSAPMEASASAPPLPLEPSAPISDTIKAISSAECVVCLDLECEIIFVPCGHICCCCHCSKNVSECPLCRSSIERKITLVL